MRKHIIFFFLIFTFYFSFAQLPETTIYLFQYNRMGRNISITDPKIISFNKGYNNQPYFSPDGKYLYFVSAKDTDHVNIFKVDVSKKRKKVKQITKTKEAEYSPKYTPDMEFISHVRVEKDRKTQHFAKMTLKGKKTEILMPAIGSVGYYEWLNMQEVLTFELPEPFYLVKHNLSTNKTDTLATHIGRTFYYLKSKNKIIYIDKSDTNQWCLRAIPGENLRSYSRAEKKENVKISDVLPMEEDYCITQEGNILMGHNGVLYMKKNPLKNVGGTWDQIADFKMYGIDKFYRIAISPDNTMLAVVAYKGKKP